MKLKSFLNSFVFFVTIPQKPIVVNTQKPMKESQSDP